MIISANFKTFSSPQIVILQEMWHIKDKVSDDKQKYCQYIVQNTLNYGNIKNMIYMNSQSHGLMNSAKLFKQTLRYLFKVVCTLSS